MRLSNWLKARGWKLYPFQRRAYRAYREGNSGIISVPTGAGKTLAAVLGPLEDAAGEGLRLLYVTPLKAVARDIEKALCTFVEGMGGGVTIETRTGDTSSYRKTKQRTRLPNVLITTPESLSLLLSYPTAAPLFANLRCLVIDEWHELLGSKRGSLLELSAARLRALRPSLQTWALSATLANLQDAARTACACAEPTIIEEKLRRPLIAESLIPDQIGALAWAGHLGLRMLPELLARIDIQRSALIFTNTRSFCERWHRAILDARPEWSDRVAIHHGSLSSRDREAVEARVKSGALKLVVTTSSLDLGVDFPMVEQVFQIGSPKGIARLLQRAGRASHRPGAASRITLVPTQVLELVDFSALRRGAATGEIEPRAAIAAPLDVLMQFMVTRAMGGGFTADELFDEVRTATSYATLERASFDLCLQFVTTGGDALRAYPQYRRVELHEGLYKVIEPAIARLHRMNIGTIVSQSAVQISFMRGGILGSIDESFVSRLRHGDTFYFAGRTLRFLRIKDMTAYVRLAPAGSEAAAPRWSGNKLPFTPQAGDALRREIGLAASGRGASPETRALAPIWKIQRHISHIPHSGELLVETLKTREGFHLYLYPFEGSQVHEGLAAILALRLARHARTTFSIAVDDHGLELLTADAYPFVAHLDEALSPVGVGQDIEQAVNLDELSRRQFREIARIAGLTFQNHGRALKTARQVQASAGLIFDVLNRHEPGNPLIAQARGEVRTGHFLQPRLIATLGRLAASRRVVRALPRPGPFSFPLLVERMGSQLSTETLVERLQKMKARWAESPT